AREIDLRQIERGNVEERLAEREDGDVPAAGAQIRDGLIDANGSRLGDPVDDSIHRDSLPREGQRSSESAVAKRRTDDPRSDISIPRASAILPQMELLAARTP